MPQTVTDITIAEHYTWGAACDGWHLLKQADLSVIQERVPPGAGEVAHHHERARQFFFILEGRATIEFDDHLVPLGPQQGVHVPPGVPHRFTNPGPEPVRFLVISAPSAAGDRIYQSPVSEEKQNE